ncbi:MAG: DNA alkylation repair protein [Candidatus Levybacteria bacterium CG10_big_fil_rev_8_21_14_0_10_35_13]|nr:MAG: DNA alkylation repair protein [Candidatus Levybacteria bacterium CG10_big_fil_rev_8_21_14_0_10_35_13]
MNNTDLIIAELNAHSRSNKSEILSRFFKTGEGDIFIGVMVPEQRTVAKKYKHSTFAEIKKLLESKIHEHRLTGLLILVEQFKEGNDAVKEKIFNFYFDNIKAVNNWDLVDLTADKIVGEWLLNKDKKLLFELAKSSDLWKRRISIVSTFAFIKKGKFNTTLEISELLLNDSHDLIQKAVGWMLREVGKRDQNKEEQFLNKYYTSMPRTMLRYAIERFDPSKRAHYMQKN